MGRPKKNPNTLCNVPVKKITSLESAFDIITSTDILWEIILKRLSRLSRIFGFNRIETPLLEDCQLYESFFQSSSKQLDYLATLEVDNKTICLRPKILPSVLRAYFEHKIFENFPLCKWFYQGTTVNREKKGNLVYDYEFGFEVLGNFTHLTEAQLVSGVWEFLNSLGLKELNLEINHIGDVDCQKVYSNQLQDFLSGKKYELCDVCSENLLSRPLNVFRCPNLDCQTVFAEAPTILDFLDPQSHKHFTNILEALDELGIPYQLNPLYVGPDNSSKTNFVIKCKVKNENLVLGEGGYHDTNMQYLCGKNFCCFGFYGSLLKLYGILSSLKTAVSKEQTSDVFLVPLGELAAKKSLRLFRDLITAKIAVYDHFGNGGVKNQLKMAESYKAPIALIMGQKEALDEIVILRDVKSGMQEIISYDKIVEEVKKRLGK
jgi:histidyl-tRNA synthetase